MEFYLKYFKIKKKFKINIKLFNTYLFIFNKFGYIKFFFKDLKSMDYYNLTKFIKIIKNYIYFSNYKYYIELYITGLGYHALKKKKLLRFSLGHNHFIFIKIPKNIQILTKKNSLILLTSNKMQLKNFANILKELKPLNTYKEQGIYFKNDKLKFKIGKQIKN
jgi:ribosomal protein L6P/L9E